MAKLLNSLNKESDYKGHFKAEIVILISEKNNYELSLRGAKCAWQVGGDAFGLGIFE